MSKILGYTVELARVVRGDSFHVQQRQQKRTGRIMAWEKGHGHIDSLDGTIRSGHVFSARVIAVAV